jgi:hypothetical protein
MQPIRRDLRAFRLRRDGTAFGRVDPFAGSAEAQI